MTTHESPACPRSAGSHRANRPFTSRLAAAVIGAVLLGAGTGVAVAQQGGQAPTEAPGKPDLKAVAAGTYTVDPAHTLIGFRVSHFGFNDYFGILGDSTGTLVFDPAAPSRSKLEIRIPIADVTTASQELTAHLKTDDFFGVEKFPEATFVSRAIRGNGPQYEIDGDLTLKGKQLPVTLKARFTGAGVNPMNQAETIGFQATTTIKRSAFGINYGLPLVSDAVELDISAAFERTKPTAAR